MLNAMTNMVAQDFLFDAAQGSTNRGDLRHDINAIAILFDHAGNSPYLAFDALQAF